MKKMFITMIFLVSFVFVFAGPETTFRARTECGCPNGTQLKTMFKDEVIHGFACPECTTPLAFFRRDSHGAPLKKLTYGERALFFPISKKVTVCKSGITIETMDTPQYDENINVYYDNEDDDSEGTHFATIHRKDKTYTIHNDNPSGIARHEELKSDPNRKARKLISEIFAIHAPNGEKVDSHFEPGSPKVRG